MTDTVGSNESQANILCKSCGLCCTGHLFSRTKLRSAELDSARELGLNVLGSHPRQRGFSQPCPLWQGQCTVYSSPDYPHFCRTYKCKLLKQVLDETTTLPDALTAVRDTKGIIQEIELYLPGSPHANFRERLVAQLEDPEEISGRDHTDSELRRKADALLSLYGTVFGVKDFIDLPDEE